MSAGPGKDKDMVAVILADPFTDDLDPLTYDRPNALLPVANTPMIEYALEALVMNGVKEARILTFQAADALEQHLGTSVGYTGKTWLDSAEITVKIVKGQSGVNSTADALRDALHRNQLPEQFFLLPVGFLSTVGNLSQLWARHTQRAGKVVVTACCLERRSHLEDVHAAVAQRALRDTEGAVSPVTTAGGEWPGAAGQSMMFPGADFLDEDDGSAVRLHTALDYITVAYQPSNNNAATAYQSWTENERALARQCPQSPQPGMGAHAVPSLENAIVPITLGKANVRVRTDLINTGMYVCSSTLVTEVLMNEVMVRDMNDVLRHLVDNPEYCEYQFAVDYVSDVGPQQQERLQRDMFAATSPAPQQEPGSPVARAPQVTMGLSRRLSHPRSSVNPGGDLPVAFGATSAAEARTVRNTAVAFPVTNVTGYLQANLGVCERRLFPLSRERNFADKGSPYSAWPHMPSVFTHAHLGTRLSPSATIGPNVVLGAELKLGKAPRLVNCCVGNRCQLQSHVTVCNSVVMDNVRLGAEAVLYNCVVGHNVRICAGVNLNSCVVGDNVTITATDAGRPPIIPAGARLFTAPGAKADPVYVGEKGVGALHPHSQINNALSRPPDTLPLDALFTRDPVAGGEDDEDDVASNLSDQARAEAENFFDAIYNEMEAVVQSTALRETTLPGWRGLMLSYGRNLDDLCCALTRALMQYVGRMYADDGAKAAFKALKTQVKFWVHDVYRQLMRRAGADSRTDMCGVLRGVALALASNDGAVLRSKAANIVSLLYLQADPELEERDGFCVVSYDSIILFDDFVAQDLTHEGAAWDKADIRDGWAHTADYVQQLRDA